MCTHSHSAEGKMLCPQCDLLVELPDLRPGQRALCPRCNTLLTSHRPEARWRSVSFAVSALVMLFLSTLFPFVSMQVAGITSEVTLLEIPKVMVDENYASVATLFMLFVQCIPACCMLIIIGLCGHVRMNIKLTRLLARILFQLKSWGMSEIFLAGVLVSFVKLMAYGSIGIGISFIPYVLFCLLQLLAFQSLDRRRLWHDVTPAPTLPDTLEAGRSGIAQGMRACRCCAAVLPADNRVCPRCHTHGHLRRRHSLQWTMALLITSIMLYVPANLMPIMVTEALGNRMDSTIMSGVVLLWESGSYPVALVIFIASIMVPTLKMIALGWLCWCTQGKSRHDTERMHLVYEVVEFVGRWSMIDVFVIAVLSALVRVGRFMSVYPEIGAVLFAAVVILTMLAAIMFDPRLLWDRYNRE